MRRCPTSLVIIKIQIKTTMRYFYTFIRLAKIKKRKNNTQTNPTMPNVSEDAERWRFSRTALEMQNRTAIWKTIWQW